jgi:hypothetical protein
VPVLLREVVVDNSPVRATLTLDFPLDVHVDHLDTRVIVSRGRLRADFKLTFETT